MITVSTNINKVVQVTVTRLAEIGDTDRLLRECATSVLDLMKKRIHRNGIAADGSQIGTYSAGYMKVRTGNFGNSKRVSRGANKGNLKDAGVFTDRTIRLNKNTGVFTGEDKVGTARPRYNRGSDTKVIASLTREMENDMKVIGLSNGAYGIGYTNKHNFDKSQWVEATYKKPIFSLAETEKTAITEIVNNAISG